MIETLYDLNGKKYIHLRQFVTMGINRKLYVVTNIVALPNETYGVTLVSFTPEGSDTINYSTERGKYTDKEVQ